MKNQTLYNELTNNLGPLDARYTKARLLIQEEEVKSEDIPWAKEVFLQTAQYGSGEITRILLQHPQARNYLDADVLIAWVKANPQISEPSYTHNVIKTLLAYEEVKQNAGANDNEALCIVLSLLAEWNYRHDGYEEMLCTLLSCDSVKKAGLPAKAIEQASAMFWATKNREGVKGTSLLYVKDLLSFSSVPNKIIEQDPSLLTSLLENVVKDDINSINNSYILQGMLQHENIVVGLSEPLAIQALHVMKNQPKIVEILYKNPSIIKYNEKFNEQKKHIKEGFDKNVNELEKELLQRSAKAERAENLCKKLISEEVTLLDKLKLESTHVDVQNAFNEFIRGCQYQIDQADKSMDHSLLYQVIEGFVKAIVGLFAAIGMTLGAGIGQGWAKAEHRQSFQDTFTHLSKTEASKKVVGFLMNNKKRSLKKRLKASKAQLTKRLRAHCVRG